MYTPVSSNFNVFDWFVSHSSVADNKVKNSVPCFFHWFGQVMKCKLDFSGEYFKQVTHAGHKPDLTFGSLVTWMPGAARSPFLFLYLSLDSLWEFASLVLWDRAPH